MSEYNYNCAFCRNPGATNKHEYKGDFIYVMCEGCDAQYKEHSQLGPKFAYCLCNPDKPRELEISMANSEIDASVKTKTTEIQKEINDPKIKIVKFEEISEYVNKTYPDFAKQVTNYEGKKESKKSKKVSNL